MENKICNGCKEAKPLTEYNKSSTQKSGLRTRCKTCERESARDFYRKHPNGYKKRAAIQRDKIREYLGKVISEIRERRGCAFCPERTPCVLDFHHVIKGEPITRVASKGYGRFEQELRKCVVVCANCHRKIHAGLLTPTPDMLCDEIIGRHYIQ